MSNQANKPPQKDAANNSTDGSNAATSESSGMSSAPTHSAAQQSEQSEQPQPEEKTQPSGFLPEEVKLEVNEKASNPPRIADEQIMLGDIAVSREKAHSDGLIKVDGTLSEKGKKLYGS